MGRIRTKLIKRITSELMNKNSDKFKKDYADNKKILADLVDNPSKKLRNVLAGSVTRAVKHAE